MGILWSGGKYSPQRFSASIRIRVGCVIEHSGDRRLGTYATYSMVPGHIRKSYADSTRVNVLKKLLQHPRCSLQVLVVKPIYDQDSSRACVK